MFFINLIFNIFIDYYIFLLYPTMTLPDLESLTDYFADLSEF